MAKKQVDTLKAKQKKQKIIAAVLGVVFVGLLAFQVPRVMKQMHRGSAQAAVPATVSTSTTTTPTLEAPSDEAPGLSLSCCANGSLLAKRLNDVS